jgi:hypothetical protein
LSITKKYPLPTLNIASLQRRRVTRYLLLFFLTLVTFGTFAGCAFGPDRPNHHFSFDAGIESPEIEVLDYQYGNSKLHSASNPDYLRAEGKSLQGTNIYGSMLRGDFLYVKWRIRSTGQIYEDRVDLRHRLPSDLTGFRIHFVIRGAQLYIYLISPKRVTGRCPYTTFEESTKVIKTLDPHDTVLFMYCYREVTQVYPDQPTINNRTGKTE